MRFSAIFQLPLPQRLVAAARLPPAREEDAAAAPVAPALPTPAAAAAAVPVADDRELELDQRVRLIGEWQLGEAT
jgi:hypothetical protein